MIDQVLLEAVSPRDMQLIYGPKGKAAGAAHLFLTETREGGIGVIGTIYEY